MSYQHISGKPGHSKSEAKLEAIMLPDLVGKRFLDIGCNEGFFCVEAVRRGASRVVGIEANEKYAVSARFNCPKAEILNQTWDSLPGEKFDVIIMLSALHYEKRPKDLMKRIYDRLAPGGLFIFEGGVVLEEDEYWVEVKRSTGAVMYPTLGLLRDHILEDFAVRKIGPSVDQDGDPLPRHVFHCYRKMTNFVIVPGVSRSGKTILAYDFRKLGAPIVSTDEFLLRQAASEYKTSDPLFNDYISKIDAEFINEWVDGINNLDLKRSVAQFIFKSLPKESDIVILEGYVFSNKPLVYELIEILDFEGFRAWYAEKLTAN